MPLPTTYSTGTASVANGATTLTIVGAVSNAIYAGDFFMDPAQPLVPPQRIASVTGGGVYELAVGWPGTTMVAAPYVVHITPDSVRVQERTREVLEALQARAEAWKGPWTTATDYVVTDEVGEGGSSYICVAGHTSGTFATDLAAGKWQLLAAAGTDGVDGVDGTNGTDGVDGVGVPAGGSSGQVLKKASAADFDTEWADESGGAVGNNLAIAGDQDLTVSPTGNTTSTSSSLSVQATTDEASKREFLANFGLISNLGNGLGTPTEDKVTVYAGIQGQSGTGAIWAGNFLTRMDAASGSYSAHGIEIDLDNLNAHRGDSDLSEPSVWGLNLSGASTFRSTGAILVSGAADQWNRGITFANDSIVKATFQDLANADISLDIQGSHITGLDLHQATISGYAVSLGSGHSIGWNTGDVTIVHSANQLTFAGAETAYSFESDESNGTTMVRVLNNADDATVTKLMAIQFSGRDTTNALKEAARIEVAPPNDNWVGADMRMYVRAGSGEAVTEALRLGSDLSVKALSPTGGLGYGTGAGGTVTQATSKATGVTLNKVTGQITMNAAALGANAEVTFTLTNSAIAANDILVFNHSLTAKYVVNAVCAAGSAAITVRNVTAGSLSEALVLKYAVIKAAAA